MGRLGSGVRVNAGFQKIPRLVGRLGSAVRVNAGFQKIPRLVGRLGSGVRVSAGFQKNPRLVGRLGSGVYSRVSVGFQIFALTASGMSYVGKKLSGR